MSDKIKKFEGKELKDMLAVSDTDDVVMVLAKLAFKNFEAGRITKDALVYALKACVNMRATENGYADRFGLPFGFGDF